MSAECSRIQNEEVLIALVLHGLKERVGKIFYAPVLLNTRHGWLSPAPPNLRFFSDSDCYWKKNCEKRGAPEIPRVLATAPRWQGVVDDPDKLIVLGETYSYV